MATGSPSNNALKIKDIYKIFKKNKQKKKFEKVFLILY